MENTEKWEGLVRSYVASRKIDFLFLGASILLGVYFNWNVVEIAIFTVFIWSLIGPIPSRFLAVPALFFLVLTPVLLILEREDQAEEFSIYAYFFFIMAVIRGIIEIRQGNIKKKGG